MNNGAFGENFPYSNFHDLNMDWIIKIAKDFLDQYTHIQEIISEGEQSLLDKTSDGLEQLEDKADALETLLQQWYDTHSADIANELASAIADLQSALTTAIASFGTSADQKAAQTLESIPDDYTALSNDVVDIKKEIKAFNYMQPTNWTMGVNIDATGELQSNPNVALSDPIPAIAGDYIVRLSEDNGEDDWHLLFYVNEFNGDTWYRRTALPYKGDAYVIQGATQYIRIGFGYANQSGIDISQNQIDTYFKMNFYQHKNALEMRGNIPALGLSTLSACNVPGVYTFTTGNLTDISDMPSEIDSGGILITYRNDNAIWQTLENASTRLIRYSTSGQWTKQNQNDAFMMRGRVTDLGYTALGSCTLPGAYVFTTGDLATLTDAPTGIDGGGLLLTYVNGTRVWQMVYTLTTTYIRYGFTGSWYNTRDQIRVSYTSGSGQDSSTEHIDIDIPTDTVGNLIRYQLGHCVNADIKANMWRLMYVFTINESGVATVINRHGEFECALKLSGWDNFVGGITHGYEQDALDTFFMDGVPTSKSNCTGYCKEFKLVRNSIMYDRTNPTREIARHGCEYIFDQNGLQVKQTVKWGGVENLSTCYLAMLPILKDFSTYRYDDTDFIIRTNSDTNYNVVIPNAKSVTEYDSRLSATMEITEYPTGMTGGDKAEISDNGGLTYNKVYFIVCSSGTTSANEIWKSTTKYKIIK